MSHSHPGDEEKPRFGKRYPWVALGILWTVSFINQADRSVLVTVMPALRDEFHLSNLQLALLNSGFLWAYALSAIFAGWLGDRLPRSRVILFGLVAWSLATAGAPLSTSFVMLLGLRGVTGLFEALYYPSGTALIGEWHKGKTRSFALSVHQTAVFAGPALGAYLAGVLADRLGWRVPFWVFCGAGLMLALGVARFLRDPAKSPEPEVKAPSKAPSLAPGALRAVLTNPVAMILSLAFFFATGASQAVMVWAPTYVHDALHLNLQGSALYSVAPIYLSGFLVVPVSGFLGDKLTTRFTLGRITLLTVGCAIAAVFLCLLAVARTGPTVAGCLALCYVGKGLFDGCIYAAMQDVTEPRVHASAVGLMTSIGFLGAGIFPIVVSGIAALYGLAIGLAALSALFVCAVFTLIAARAQFASAIGQLQAQIKS